MELGSLLRPGGDWRKPVPYLLALAIAGGSGPLAVALQHSDYLWLGLGLAYALLYAVVILAMAHTLVGLFGEGFDAAWGLVIAVVAGSLVAQCVGLYLEEQVLGLAPHPHKTYLYRLGLVRGPLLWWGICAAAWYMSARGAHRAAEVASAEIAAGSLRASTAEARLQALQAQVEPHFLFNTLAHVKWLYRRDPERGRRMLDRFLDYLHAALPRVRRASSTLEQELELAHAYLDLHQLRIGGRLTYTIEVPPTLARIEFPPLMLLTLVENAIKHGIAPQVEGGSIGIRAHATEQVTRIEVRDTGAGLRQAGGSGMGLANVRARLSALFGAGARLVIEPNLPHGVVAAIEIPR